MSDTENPYVAPEVDSDFQSPPFTWNWGHSVTNVLAWGMVLTCAAIVFFSVFALATEVLVLRGIVVYLIDIAFAGASGLLSFEVIRRLARKQRGWPVFWLSSVGGFLVLMFLVDPILTTLWPPG